MDRSRAVEVMEKVEAFYDEFRERTPAGRRLILGRLSFLKGELRSLSDDGYLWELFSKLEVACAELSKPNAESSREERQVVFGLGDVSGMRARLVTLGLLPE